MTETSLWDNSFGLNAWLCLCWKSANSRHGSVAESLCIRRVSVIEQLESNTKVNWECVRRLTDEWKDASSVRMCECECVCVCGVCVWKPVCVGCVFVCVKDNVSSSFYMFMVFGLIAPVMQKQGILISSSILLQLSLFSSCVLPLTDGHEMCFSCQWEDLMRWLEWTSVHGGASKPLDRLWCWEGESFDPKNRTASRERRNLPKSVKA